DARSIAKHCAIARRRASTHKETEMLFMIGLNRLWPMPATSPGRPVIALEARRSATSLKLAFRIAHAFGVAWTTPFTGNSEQAHHPHSGVFPQKPV
ncbi:MAG TPA: hypothetical protein VFG67_02510, partial [Oleiagrimonas sp.]|nr:hypothetical protein [Oleiagrimonas sp.]